MTQLRAYRNCHGEDIGRSLSCFDLDNTDAWINSIVFQAYMNTINGTYDEYRTQNSTPFSSRAPSHARSSLGSHASPRANSVFSLASHASFIPPSRTPSSRASSPCDKDVIVISDSDSDGFPATVSAPLVIPKIEPLPAPPLLIPLPIARHIQKGAKANRKQLRARFNSPVGNRTLKIDWYLRKEDQDSWGGSGGHSISDAMVTGLFPGCECYEPDAAAMRELWKHELDANEGEAVSAPGIISRFNLLSGAKSRAMEFRYSNTCQVGLLMAKHHYLPIPNNVDEDTLQIATKNGGQLPTAPTVNEMCALTVHPRIGKGLQTCRSIHTYPALDIWMTLLSRSTYPAYNTRIVGTSRDVPEFPGDFNTQFGPAADDDLGNLPTLPMPTSPLLYEPSLLTTTNPLLDFKWHKA
ncbi:hypothetical protein DFH08DRAFT_825711 [Mycena albidolilacea]|uniref:Uncharacterized protein n=1 Tax=Mycena albidolilacea TaxID=1033008 RepID=A0AAD7E931_9AGAR|nr:hypothetical protein DFH08DRAFT_825711 [Mycena albidolilacea]